MQEDIHFSDIDSQDDACFLSVCSDLQDVEQGEDHSDVSDGPRCSNWFECTCENYDPTYCCDYGTLFMCNIKNEWRTTNMRCDEPSFETNVPCPWNAEWTPP